LPGIPINQDKGADALRNGGAKWSIQNGQDGRRDILYFDKVKPFKLCQTYQCVVIIHALQKKIALDTKLLQAGIRVTQTSRRRKGKRNAITLWKLNHPKRKNKIPNKFHK
jgi:hypothetical protein